MTAVAVLNGLENAEMAAEQNPRIIHIRDNAFDLLDNQSRKNFRLTKDLTRNLIDEIEPFMPQRRACALNPKIKVSFCCGKDIVHRYINVYKGRISVGKGERKPLSNFYTIKMASQLELLTVDENRIPSVAEKVWAPSMCGVLGFGAACFINWGTRRPIFSGIQKHVFLSGSGAVIGQYVDNRRNLYLAERDAILRRYIELHPDDFPQPERKKYSEVFGPWIPVR